MVEPLLIQSFGEAPDQCHFRLEIFIAMASALLDIQSGTGKKIEGGAVIDELVAELYHQQQIVRSGIRAGIAAE